MFNRNALLLVAGGAFFALSTASAQGTGPRSTRRIPVSKEAPGEVAPPRVDTVTVYRTDTLRMQGRTDTLRVTGPTVMVHDTVVQTINAARPRIAGMYFGLAGGVGLPYGAIRTVQEAGELGQIQVGYHGLNSLFGVRLDGTYNKYARNPEYGGQVFGDRPQMMNLNADLRLNLPLFNAFLGSSVRMTPYLVGGGSWVRYQNLRMKIDADGVAAGQIVGGVGPAHAVIAIDNGGSMTPNSAWHSDYGFNFGGGLGFHAGKKEIFVESRGIRFTHAKGGITGATGTNGREFHAAYNVPIVFGVNFF